MRLNPKPHTPNKPQSTSQTPPKHPTHTPQDLERTQVEYAEAVFIAADKYAADARTEDRAHSLALLAVGQYLAVRRLWGGGWGVRVWG